MATSLRSRRIAEQQARAKRTGILWMHRRNALHCLTGIERLGEKTIVWTQKLLDACRDQYTDIETLTEIDALQQRLDHQKELLRRRINRDGAAKEADKAAKAAKKAAKYRPKVGRPRKNPLPQPQPTPQPPADLPW